MLKNIIFCLLFTLNYSTEYNSLIDAIKNTNPDNLPICNGDYVLNTNEFGIIHVESNFFISILDLFPSSIILILCVRILSVITELKLPDKIDEIISINKSIIIIIIITLIQSIVHLVRISNITALKKQKCIFILHRKSSGIMYFNIAFKILGIFFLFMYHCVTFYSWYANKPISSLIILNIINVVVHIIYVIITIQLSNLFSFIGKIRKHKDLPTNYLEDNYHNTPNKYLVLNIDNEKVIMNI